MISRNKALASCTALALTGGLVSQAQAQEFMEGLHPYVGASYGLYKSGDGDYDEDRDLWEVYGGLALHEYFGVEANWTNLGEMSNDFSDVEIDGWGLSAVGQIPFTENFKGYLKVGQFWWDAEVNVTTANMGDVDASFDDEDMFYTLGAAMEFAEPWSATLEYTRYETGVNLDELDQLDEAVQNSDAGDIDTVKLGIRFAF